jgi:hypothetical protein
MTRFTLHVPETFNDGTPVGPEFFETLERDLLDRVGGFTLTHAIGAWQGEGGRYREAVRLYAIYTDDLAVGTSLHILAERVAEALRQEAVYLTSAHIQADLIYAPLHVLAERS